MNAKRKQESLGLRVERVLAYIVLIILCLITIFPLWILITNATRSNTEINSGLSLMFSNHLVDNWHIITDYGINPLRIMFNSFFIAGTSTFFTLYSSAMMAYGLVVYEFKLRGFLSLFIVCLLVIPGQMIAIGFFKIVYQMGLTNNWLPLILPSIAAPAVAFFIRQYLRGCLSLDIVNAGRIDGAAELYIFNRIMLPIMGPAIFTQGVFTFLGSWNNLFMPSMLLSSKDLITVPLMIMLFKDVKYAAERGAQFLGMVSAVLPITIVYFFVSSRIIDGIALGGLKE